MPVDPFGNPQGHSPAKAFHITLGDHFTAALWSPPPPKCSPPGVPSSALAARTAWDLTTNHLPNHQACRQPSAGPWTRSSDFCCIWRLRAYHGVAQT